ncbi:MAG: Rpn family recombination-promoting nuclease/putative transposase [Brachyspira sp.]|nr:Rpn family recombination-promoting nuclease/putative transposase [Brachyspira sp.]
MQINLFRHCETLLILKPAFGDDCFIRYLFSDEGNENIVLDFINGVMIDLNFQTFNNVVILNPFNLTKYLDGKESIVDVPKGRRAKCITEDNQTVIIEIQLQGNQYFIRRSLYYWANSYSSLLNKSENYTRLSPVISINVLDFVLFNDIKDFHSCYLLKEIKHNKILTDHCMLHYIELPKFNLNNDKEKLSSWIKFFKGENMSNLIKENNIFKKRDYDIAKNLKQMNIDNTSISKAIGLSIDEIKKTLISFFKLYINSFIIIVKNNFKKY